MELQDLVSRAAGLLAEMEGQPKRDIAPRRASLLESIAAVFLVLSTFLFFVAVVLFFRMTSAVQELPTVLHSEATVFERHVRSEIAATGNLLYDRGMEALQFSLYNFSVPTAAAKLMTGNFSDLASLAFASSQAVRWVVADVHENDGMNTMRKVADLVSPISSKVQLLQKVDPLPGSSSNPNITSNDVLSIVDNLLAVAKMNAD